MITKLWTRVRFLTGQEIFLFYMNVQTKSNAFYSYVTEVEANTYLWNEWVYSHETCQWLNYSPTGRRNHGRPLKRLLDTWDRNGSTSSPTPWQIDDDGMSGFLPLCVLYKFLYYIYNCGLQLIFLITNIIRLVLWLSTWFPCINI